MCAARCRAPSTLLLQVLIPDVQKLINQLGNVNTDLFASRLLRPPSSVLLLPLRASGVGETQCSVLLLLLVWHGNTLIVVSIWTARCCRGSKAAWL